MNGLEQRIYNTTLAYIGYGVNITTKDIRDKLAVILPIFENEKGVYDIQTLTAALYNFYGF